MLVIGITCIELMVTTVFANERSTTHIFLQRRQLFFAIGVLLEDVEPCLGDQLCELVAVLNIELQVLRAMGEYAHVLRSDRPE